MKTLNLAKYTSLITAVLLVLAGITATLEITIPSLIFGFLLVLAFIAWIACIHLTSERKKVLSFLGIVFSVMYGILISFNYFLQLGFMGRNIQIPELLAMSNPDSIFWVIEILGYFFMGLTTLVLIPLFSSNLLGRSIQFLFFINAFLGIGGVAGYMLNWSLNVMLGGLVVWNIIMPIAAILVFFHFNQVKIRVLKSATTVF